jgi:hypothetical protein
VLAYLARYTHRVAISNSRLIGRYRTMTLAPDEFIRRFLLHVLPKGLHRIRHYGLLATAACKASIARARELIAGPMPPMETPEHDDAGTIGTVAEHRPPCPCCGGRMIIVETFERGGAPRRDLRARWRTPRPAIARCRGRDRNVMTAVIASLHHPPAGTGRSRRRTAVAPVPAKADAMPPIVTESHPRAQRRRPILDNGRHSPRNDAAQFFPRRSCCPIKSP